MVLNHIADSFTAWSSPWKGNYDAATEIMSFMVSKFCYHVLKSLPLDPIQSQMNPAIVFITKLLSCPFQHCPRVYSLYLPGGLFRIQFPD